MNYVETRFITRLSRLLVDFVHVNADYRLQVFPFPRSPYAIQIPVHEAFPVLDTVVPERDGRKVSVIGGQLRQPVLGVPQEALLVGLEADEVVRPMLADGRNDSLLARHGIRVDVLFQPAQGQLRGASLLQDSQFGLENAEVFLCEADDVPAQHASALPSKA